MGNRNSRPPSSPATPAITSTGGIVQNLQEDIKCSICLQPFNDPVSIDCGHNFCRECLSVHWSGFSPCGYRCPECRHPCSRERMKPDIRLRNLVEKIGQIPFQLLIDEKQVRPNVEEVPTTPLQLRQAVQLVGLDENGDLCLNEEALNHCFEQEQVKDAHVCLVSIFGEQRRGKSFLLNFLLKRLQNLEAEDDSWMGQEDELLTGFDWRPGSTTITKGVWIWSQPFWVPSEDGQKVAVFLIDTEGSMDVERSKESGVKLSAFSMLLSSYQILNLTTTMTDTDLEYLEMFVHVVETVGHSCKLKTIQQLDILVRDWFFPPIYGLQQGHVFLQEVIKKLESHRGKHRRALSALRSTSTRCYLMPFPGKQLVAGTQGTLAEMDADFKEYLKDYGNDIARSAGKHVKRDQEGVALTGARLASTIKNFSALMKQHKFGFSSTTQMAITLYNVGIQEDLWKKFAEFISEQEQTTSSWARCLKVTPTSMTLRFLKKQEELVQECEMLLQGDESDRQDFILPFKTHLEARAKVFLELYKRHYTSQALKVGATVGVGVLSLAGGGIGAGVAGALVATEAVVLSTSAAATFAIGTTAGAGTFAILGGAVGARVGKHIGGRRAREAENAENVQEGDAEAEETEDNMSEETCLIDQQDTP